MVCKRRESLGKQIKEWNKDTEGGQGEETEEELKKKGGKEELKKEET